MENICNNWRSEGLSSGLMCLKTIEILSLSNVWEKIGKQTKIREQNTFDVFWANKRAHVPSSAVPELPVMWKKLSKRSNAIHLVEISTSHWVLLDSKRDGFFGVCCSSCLQVQSQARCPQIILHTEAPTDLESNYSIVTLLCPSFTAPSLRESKECLDSTLCHMAGFFGCPVQSLTLMALVTPFSSGYFVTMWYQVRSLAHKDM